MAYAFTTNDGVRSGKRLIITVKETDAASSSEWGPIRVPKAFRVKRITCTLDSGSGTTVAPTLGSASGWSASSQQEIVGAPTTPAAHIDDATEFDASAPHGLLYGKSGVDSGSDNVIDTTIILEEE